MQTLVSTKYQVVIPKEVRKKLAIKPGQKMDIEITENKIVLSKPKQIQKDWDLEYYRKKLGGIWTSAKDIDDYLEEQDHSWE
jgi:AbrB family looped-hinge helix DNA binding protein